MHEAATRCPPPSPHLIQRLRGHSMMTTRRFAALAAALSLGFAAACGDSDPTGPNPTPVLGVTVTAINSSSTRVTFTSRAGDNSYNIERAEGASGSFSSVGTVPAPSTPGPVTFNDANLKAN